MKRSFPTEDKLQRHVALSHGGGLGGQSVRCEMCSYETTNPRLLKLHLRRSHFQPHECPKCSKVGQI